ncbi:hypothetical protein CALVIDRAFT_343089 [Calocera viscosa TUFC12733]|uniref:Uncharacterized protein n=1 Tax=Calocera viscosa (strain TUFC12733) TaxID=1330018 RepID=A0A167HFY9_CALVF|nr:hypothetical protein CALVIDRAFT_343089 [Calocera viscosa TUFC12733]
MLCSSIRHVHADLISLHRRVSVVMRTFGPSPRSGRRNHAMCQRTSCVVSSHLLATPYLVSKARLGRLCGHHFTPRPPSTAASTFGTQYCDIVLLEPLSPLLPPFVHSGLCCCMDAHKPCLTCMLLLTNDYIDHLEPSAFESSCPALAIPQAAAVRRTRRPAMTFAMHHVYRRRR